MPATAVATAAPKTKKAARPPKDKVLYVITEGDPNIVGIFSDAEEAMAQLEGSPNRKSYRHVIPAKRRATSAE